MKLGRLRSNEWIAGLAGAGLIAVMFVPLYSSEVEGLRVTQNGWEALTTMPIVASIAGALGIALFVVGAWQRSGAVSIALAGFAMLVAVIDLVVVLVRVIWPPDLVIRTEVFSDGGLGSVQFTDVAREGWLFVALALALLFVVACWRLLGDERFGRGALQDPALRAAGTARLLPTPPASGTGTRAGEQA